MAHGKLTEGAQPRNADSLVRLGRLPYDPRHGTRCADAEKQRGSPPARRTPVGVQQRGGYEKNAADRLHPGPGGRGHRLPGPAPRRGHGQSGFAHLRPAVYDRSRLPAGCGFFPPPPGRRPDPAPTPVPHAPLPARLFRGRFPAWAGHRPLWRHRGHAVHDGRHGPAPRHHCRGRAGRDRPDHHHRPQRQPGPGPGRPAPPSGNSSRSRPRSPGSGRGRHRFPSTGPGRPKDWLVL